MNSIIAEALIEGNTVMESSAFDPLNGVVKSCDGYPNRQSVTLSVPCYVIILNIYIYLNNVSVK